MALIIIDTKKSISKIEVTEKFAKMVKDFIWKERMKATQKAKATRTGIAKDVK